MHVLNFTEIVPGEPLRRVKRKRGRIAKYSDIAPVEGYTQTVFRKRCKIRPWVQLMTRRKSYPWNPMVTL